MAKCAGCGSEFDETDRRPGYQGVAAGYCDVCASDGALREMLKGDAEDDYEREYGGLIDNRRDDSTYDDGMDERDDGMGDDDDDGDDDE